MRLAMGKQDLGITVFGFGKRFSAAPYKYTLPLQNPLQADLPLSFFSQCFLFRSEVLALLSNVIRLVLLTRARPILTFFSRYRYHRYL